VLSDTGPLIKGCFVLQAEDVENEEVLFFNNEQQKSDVQQSEVKRTLSKSKPKLPKKYHGYEDLLNIDEQYPEDIELPNTVHGNVRALQYALDHPLTFTQQSARYRNEQPSKSNQRMVSYRKNYRKFKMFKDSPNWSPPRKWRPTVTV
jgi:hypothetical protein